MRRLVAAVAMILAACAAYPAIASAVPIDPVIGVRGGGGSEPSDSNAFFTMGGCPADLIGFFGNDVFCLEYDIVQDITSITSLTFQFKDASGLIPNDALFNDESAFNGFDGLEPLDDGFSVRFFFNGEFSSLLCIGGGGELPVLVPCAQGSTIQLYLHVPDNETPNPPYSASLRAINDVAVPEPGLLVLMGIGLMLAGRRLRRRRTTA
jgi:hypothetical protein